MLQLTVYSGTQAISATEADLPAVQDQSLTRTGNNHYILPQAYQLYAAYAQGATIGRARINAAKLRNPFLPYIYPLTLAALPPANPPIADYRDSPLWLPGSQEIEIDTTNTNGAGTDVETVVLFLGDGNLSVPGGAQVFTMRATAAITAVASAWTAGVLTFSQTLPDGIFGVVNMEVQSTTCIAARLIFPGPGAAWRPGCLGKATLGLYPLWQGRKFPFGIWGQFSNLAVPQLEVFCTAADTAQIVHLDLIKLS